MSRTNNKTAARTAQSLAPHLEEIACAIHKKIDGKRGGFCAAAPLVRRKISRLATLAGTRRLVKSSITFSRAMSELQGKELPHASQRREVTSAVAVIARWLDLAGLLPEPEPKKRRRTPNRIKGIRRIKVNGNWLEKHGVEMNDRLLIAMTGDVREGELGYFEIRTVYTTGSRYSHRSFFFLTKRDGACSKYEAAAGVCLRTFADRCGGHHVGAEGQGITHSPFSDITYTHSAVFFGRVIGAERGGKAVDITLRVRPFDAEREVATVRLDRSAEMKDEPPAKTQSSTPIARRLSELRAHLEMLDEGEITNCTARFKLEKQIYDLEREQAADEWPETIDA